VVFGPIMGSWYFAHADYWRSTAPRRRTAPPCYSLLTGMISVTCSICLVRGHNVEVDRSDQELHKVLNERFSFALHQALPDAAT